MTIIVTGAVGSIGRNTVKALNERGKPRVIAIDNLTKADKFKSLIEGFLRDNFGKMRAVFQDRAFLDTVQTDGRCMTENNFRNSRDVMNICLERDAQLLYASSAAAICGGSTRFVEECEFDLPLNVYDHSKLLCDQVLGQMMPKAGIDGHRETHNGCIVSVAFHNFDQLGSEGKPNLLGNYNDCATGAQTRDSVSVGNVFKVNLNFLGHSEKSGIFNIGTGRAAVQRHRFDGRRFAVRAQWRGRALAVGVCAASLDRVRAVPGGTVRQASVFRASGPDEAAVGRLRSASPGGSGGRRPLCTVDDNRND